MFSSISLCSLGSLCASSIFSRCATPGTNYFQTVKNQLSDLIQLKNPTKVKHLTDSYNVKHLTGANRDTYISPTGKGFKIGKGVDSVKDAEMERRSQRLNDIYSNPKFYGGKYANVGSLQLVTEDGRQKVATSFQLIKDAIPLQFKKSENGLGVSNVPETYEKVPQSALDELIKAGYNLWDVKPDNFVKIKNEQGSWDYLPIDAKLIGLTADARDESQPMSPRTEQVDQLQNEAKSRFAFGGKYVDKLV
ncbi:hypothetical protein [Shewanella surugensis]|uniref:Uncharacterized protein n=1 Tax=Shewanella surugensis TaxID=212020 RepID=A0ABT0L5U1_9GAMM|nr:hypothetical protein [Shewanella surugensis]MCL1122934.1 hypothetical protein [Shewanella surugensis]